MNGQVTAPNDIFITDTMATIFKIKDTTESFIQSFSSIVLAVSEEMSIMQNLMTDD